MTFRQAEFNIRCEWGQHGISQLAPDSDAVVIVDILSFSTCVDIAVARGAIVFPYRWKDATAREFAARMNAELADDARSNSRYSLSPKALMTIPPDTRLVLPSPNGATLTLATGNVPTLTACFRNYRAVASAAMRYGKRIAVIPAGERWPDGSLRPSLEDWLGAGAIISELSGATSVEAQSALAAYRTMQSRLEDSIMKCGSGKELIDRGFADDVQLACAVNVSERVPEFIDGAYRQS